MHAEDLGGPVTWDGVENEGGRLPAIDMKPDRTIGRFSSTRCAWGAWGVVDVLDGITLL